MKCFLFPSVFHKIGYRDVTISWTTCISIYVGKLNKTPRVWFSLRVLSLQYNDSIVSLHFCPSFFSEQQKYQAPTFLKIITDTRKVAWDLLPLMGLQRRNNQFYNPKQSVQTPDTAISSTILSAVHGDCNEELACNILTRITKKGINFSVCKLFN